MPPKTKVTKENILHAALSIVRENGVQALNARSVAAALQCSTQPIFSNFATMDSLQQATLAAAYDVYLSFLNKEAAREEYPKYKAFGMAYTQFASEEKELFKLLFMRDRSGEEFIPTPDFQESVQLIAAAGGISLQQAERLHLEMWTCVHGIGVMLATSFLPLERNLISDMLTDLYQGLRLRHTSQA